MKRIEQKLAFYKNLFTLLFTSMFVVGGGLATTFFLHNEVLKPMINLVLFDIGLTIEATIMFFTAYTFVKIKKLIKEF